MLDLDGLDRNEMAALYRELVSENERLRPFSEAGREIAMRPVNFGSAGRTDEERSMFARSTVATKQQNTNLEGMIQINKELAYRGEQDLSPENTGE